MKKGCGPRELALNLLHRSPCNIQVAAVLSDRNGIFAWYWNNVGDGFGMCAERKAIKQANRKRLKGAILTIAGRRKRNGRFVFCQPCLHCFNTAKRAGIKIVEHTTKDGNWINFPLQLVKMACIELDGDITRRNKKKN